MEMNLRVQKAIGIIVGTGWLVFVLWAGIRYFEFAMNEYGDAFGVEQPDTELREIMSVPDQTGAEHTVLAQIYEDLPVFGGELRAHFDRDGELSIVNGTFVAGLKINTTPTLTADQAATRAIRTVLIQQSRIYQARQRADDNISTFDVSLYADLMAGTNLPANDECPQGANQRCLTWVKRLR